MKHLIVYTHPNPKSFNHAILETVKSTLRERGDEVQVTDLYEKQFDAILSANDFVSFGDGVMPEDIQQEQALVSWADNLIFIYPIWWFNRPALLQGWIDRVFAHGYAFNEDENGFEPLLGGKTAATFATFGGKEQDIVDAFGSVDTLMAGMTVGTLGLVGIDPISEHRFFAIPTISDAQRHAMLEQVRAGLAGE
jgi:NAD(P)H dehydrogenase (quinone)